MVHKLFLIKSNDSYKGVNSDMGLHPEWLLFLAVTINVSSKFYIKEAPEKHKFISVHDVKQELSSRDQGLALPWDRLSAAPGQALRRFCPMGPARRDTGHGRPGSVGPIPVPVQ